MKLIRITSIYNEIFFRKELKRNKLGVFTDKGFIPFSDIKFIDIIGSNNIVPVIKPNKNKSINKTSQSIKNPIIWELYPML